eukprot:ctg_1006.g214
MSGAVGAHRVGCVDPTTPDRRGGRRVVRRPAQQPAGSGCRVDARQPLVPLVRAGAPARAAVVAVRVRAAGGAARHRMRAQRDRPAGQTAAQAVPLRPRPGDGARPAGTHIRGADAPAARAAGAQVVAARPSGADAQRGGCAAGVERHRRRRRR